VKGFLRAKCYYPTVYEQHSPFVQQVSRQAPEANISSASGAAMMMFQVAGIFMTVEMAAEEDMVFIARPLKQYTANAVGIYGRDYLRFPAHKRAHGNVSLFFPDATTRPVVTLHP